MSQDFFHLVFPEIGDTSNWGQVKILKILLKIRNGLVHRLAYNGDVAAGQLAVFQGASEAPISGSYGSSEQRRKTANWPRPGGLR